MLFLYILWPIIDQKIFEFSGGLLLDLEEVFLRRRVEAALFVEENIGTTSNNFIFVTTAYTRIVELVPVVTNFASGAVVTTTKASEMVNCRIEIIY